MWLSKLKIWQIMLDSATMPNVCHKSRTFLNILYNVQWYSVYHILNMYTIYLVISCKCSKFSRGLFLFNLPCQTSKPVWCILPLKMHSPSAYYSTVLRYSRFYNGWWVSFCIIFSNFILLIFKLLNVIFQK